MRIESCFTLAFLGIENRHVPNYLAGVHENINMVRPHAAFGHFGERVDPFFWQFYGRHLSGIFVGPVTM